jgi:hypothetical protein
MKRVAWKVGKLKSVPGTNPNSAHIQRSEAAALQRTRLVVKSYSVNCRTVNTGSPVQLVTVHLDQF